MTIVGGDRLLRGAGESSWGKSALVAHLQQLLGERRLLVPPKMDNVAQLERELGDYQRRQRADGQLEQGALKTGRHDDLVTAVALAMLADVTAPAWPAEALAAMRTFSLTRAAR